MMERIVTPSPRKNSNNSFIGDRFIPCRNAEKWDIQFNMNDVNFYKKF